MGSPARTTAPGLPAHNTDAVKLRPPQTLLDAFGRLAPNVRGAIWILVASLFLSAMAALMKLLGQTMSVWEMMLIRSTIALLLLSPALAANHFAAVRTRRPWAHLGRSMLGAASFGLFFLTVARIDLTLVITLGFTRNLFIVVLAALFLGEVIRARRTTATVIGFIGVMICLRPSSGDFEPWALGAIGFALIAAFVTVTVKRLTETEPPLTIVFYTYAYVGVLALVPAMLTWRTPSTHELVLVLLMALCSTLGQTCMVHGLRAGEATAVTPFEYTRMLYAFVFGYLLFGEVPTASTWIGGAIIIASSLYIAYRERSSR